MSALTEREKQVVAWLRRHAKGLRSRSERFGDRGDLRGCIATAVSATAWEKAADAIERGEPWRGE